MFCYKLKITKDNSILFLPTQDGWGILLLMSMSHDSNHAELFLIFDLYL